MHVTSSLNGQALQWHSSTWYPQAPCAIPAIKIALKLKKGEKSTEKWCRPRTELEGNHVNEGSWRVDPLSKAVACMLNYLLT